MNRSQQTKIKKTTKTEAHPDNDLLRPERIPHIWCPGCGIGVAVTAYLEAMREVDIPIEKQVVVSGIGCTGRVAGYVNIDSYHTTHGRAIPFATGLKVANPELEITVFSGDGDLVTIGGNHLIHAARRNVDINVILINNFNYGMTGGQVASTTPRGAFTSTSPYGNYEPSFNLPHLVEAAGGTYVCRWTTLHFRRLRDSIIRAFNKKDFNFIEVISPCPTSFGEPNNLGDGLDEMKWYREKSIIDHDADLGEVGISIDKDSPLIVGNFVDKERPTYLESVRERLIKEGVIESENGD